MTAVMVGILIAVLAVATVIAIHRPWWSWSLRQFKGGPGYFMPFIGHLGAMMAAPNMTEWMAEGARKFGAAHKFWNANIPTLVINDVDVSRKLMAQNNTRPPMDYFALLPNQIDPVFKHLLLNIPGGTAQLRCLRRAFEATLLSPAALQTHAVTLDACAKRLVLHLKDFSVNGQPVDILKSASDMAMDGIGYAAFGLDLDCLQQAHAQPIPGAPALSTNIAAGSTDGSTRDGSLWWEAPVSSAQFSKGLVAASRDVFYYTDVEKSSPWKVLAMVFPMQRRFIAWVANSLLPDMQLKYEREAWQELLWGLQALIKAWKEHQQQTNTAAADDRFKPALSDKGFLAQLLTLMDTDVEAGGVVGMTQVTASVVTMLLAGYETTSSAMSMAVHMLATHPEAQHKVQQELDDVLQGKPITPESFAHLPYLCGVFDETLRLYPPGDGALRQQAKTYKLPDGRTIPNETFLYINIFAAHRDPAIWPRADEFLPERFIQPGNEALAPKNPQAYMPFGHGSRSCVGSKFALLEARLTLAHLLQAYSFTPAPGCNPPKMTTGIVYTPDHVWLSVQPRKKDL